MISLNEKIRQLQELCNRYHVDLIVRYYGDREVHFIEINDDDKELFNVSIMYRNGNKIVYFELNTNGNYNGSSFTKDDIELLLSIEELTTDELMLENFITKREKEKELENEER